MTQSLTELSDALAAVVARTGLSLVAIRTGTNRHVTGLHWRSDTVVTLDQTLPALDRCTLVRSTGELWAARPAARDAAANLAALRLDSPIAPPPLALAPDPAVGALVIVLGTDPEAGPTARLGMVHRRPRPLAGDGIGAVLDLSADIAAQGGAVMDAAGRFLGLVTASAAGRATVLPHALISRMMAPETGTSQPAPVAPTPVSAPAPVAAPPSPYARGPRRGWLGLALQPITVPEPLVARAGQSSGRMVVDITAGGPAERGGLQIGDVLLALNGQSTTGSHALRAFLAEDRIGSQVEVRLLREGTVLSTFLTVGAQPG